MAKHAHTGHEPKGNRRLWRQDGLPLWNLVILLFMGMLILGAILLVLSRWF